ncbi:MULTISPECIES: alpha/beta fold hydrolase [unclassified Sinorhizobium]|uniref:alpha/beta fold hydrolase n=1 Tax=unclassified Sinorhizobium TaxID=2613772 RepID=UPI003526A66F
MHHMVETPFLRVAYEETGRSDGRPIVLVHGWPDDVRCWDNITSTLTDKGYRVLAPYLRGSGPTTFLSADTMRSGAIAALTQDLVDFLDALDLSDVVIGGYDWGARAGYGVAALFPGRLRGLVAMAAGYATSQPIKEMDYELAKAYWYEWVIALEQGREAMDKDRLRLAKFLWKTWSPEWSTKWRDFDAMAPSLGNDDWPRISIHAYLQRWKETVGAPEHEDVERRLAETPIIGVPTLVLHGALDGCNLVETSAGKDEYFNGEYERIVLDAIGHFIPQEAPKQTVEAILRLASN